MCGGKKSAPAPQPAAPVQMHDPKAAGESQYQANQAIQRQQAATILSSTDQQQPFGTELGK